MILGLVVYFLHRVHVADTDNDINKEWSSPFVLLKFLISSFLHRAHWQKLLSDFQDSEKTILFETEKQNTSDGFASDPSGIFFFEFCLFILKFLRVSEHEIYALEKLR